MEIAAAVGLVGLIFAGLAVFGGMRQKADRDAQSLMLLRDKLPAQVVREIRKSMEM